MGRNDMKGCRAVPGVRIAAICDVDSVNLGYAVEDCEKHNEKPEVFSDFRKTWERMLVHLDANGIDVRKTPPTLGSFLQFDSATERFTGALADLANRYLKREYRKGFEVPDNV